MFFPEARVRVFLYGQPVDMRKSFDGLIAPTDRALGQDPLSGHVFAFVNRRGNDRPCTSTAAAIVCGPSAWSGANSSGTGGARQELDVTGLKLLLEGIEPVRRRLRYPLGATPSETR